MLRRGYVELLTRVADTPLARQLEERIRRYVGIHLIAFGTADAEGERARLAREGFAPLPLVDLRRPGLGGPAAFAVARVPPEAMPEGRIQFCEHRTEASVWAPGRLDHPNGALALDEVVVAVADPDEAAARFARFCGRPATSLAAGHRLVATERGRLHLVDPARLGALLGATPPALPFIAAYGVLVQGLADVRRAVEAGGLAARAIGGGALAVAAPPALGGTLLFHEEGADPLGGSRPGCA
jgi:hypothetical protein